MTDLAIKAALSYLLGSIVGSLVLGRLRGVDIRELGSGNPGATNALRTQGRAFALWVFVIDIGKGWLATRVLARLGLPYVPAAGGEMRAWMPVACGAAAMVGHVYPVWHGFRGGKGAATLVGALLGLSPVLFAAVVLVWLAAATLTGYVSVASMTAAGALPVIGAVGVLEPRAPIVAFGLFVAVLVVYTHRANIARLRRGTEPRARRLWLLGRRR